MKKAFLYILSLGGILLLLSYTVIRYNLDQHLLATFKNNSLEINTDAPVLAEVSLSNNLPTRKVNTFPHFTLKIYDSDKWDLKHDMISRIPEDTPVMITVETHETKLFSYYNNPLADVKDGTYDRTIETLCTKVIGNRPHVYIRFNPEMEGPTRLYQWQQKSGYIEAFQHFFKICKTYAPQAKIVWGPASYPGAMEFYPGDDYVDVATISLKSDSEKLLKVYPKDYSIEYDLMRRVHRLRFMNKPIYVLGSRQSAKDSLTTNALAELGKHIHENRDIIYSDKNYQRSPPNSDGHASNSIAIGLYDPQSLLNDEKTVTVEHLFADFSNLDSGAFQNSFHAVEQRGHDIIVTFEPFRNPNGETDLDVLRQVSNGVYDQQIEQMYSVISSTNRKVYLRYAHEMEIPITRYPWQSQNPIDYIKSFRYFMTFMEPLPPHIARVWGPAGDRGSIEWWPGNDVVEYLSIAIYGLPDKNITDPKKQETFKTIFERKNKRMRFIDKPIFITEFGVKGPEEFQTKWLEDAAEVIRAHKQIIGVNYFNMSDTPKAWGEIKPPDWSISKASFNRFIEVLEKE